MLLPLHFTVKVAAGEDETLTRTGVKAAVLRKDLSVTTRVGFEEDSRLGIVFDDALSLRFG